MQRAYSEFVKGTSFVFCRVFESIALTFRKNGKDLGANPPRIRLCWLTIPEATWFAKPWLFRSILFAR